MIIIYFFFSICNILQGIGRKMIPIVSSIIEMFVKIGATFLLVPSFGYLGIAVCEPIAWLIMTAFLMFFFYHDERFKRNTILEIQTEKADPN
ncbi:polysaccharide biosynthesis C-terminal domain-containing protein [Romboutsia ilealis]|uniref:polysaccharide biosynthesis C-terminal domain-containing protein n=1 Tax=Romboutsia ilealis TaxID=1115758 RepID=UPI003AB93BCE